MRQQGLVILAILRRSLNQPASLISQFWSQFHQTTCRSLTVYQMQRSICWMIRAGIRTFVRMARSEEPCSSFVSTGRSDSRRASSRLHFNDERCSMPLWNGDDGFLYGHVE